MRVEKINSKYLPSCSEHDCPNHAEYEIYVAIFCVKLCKKCMEELIQKCNKLIS